MTSRQIIPLNFPQRPSSRDVPVPCPLYLRCSQDCHTRSVLGHRSGGFKRGTVLDADDSSGVVGSKVLDLETR